MGGVIVDGGNFDWNNGKFPGLSEPDPSYHGIIFSEKFGDAALAFKIRTTLLRDTGAALSPFNAFQLTQGLETLSLRMERHVENAEKVAHYLSKHPFLFHFDTHTHGFASLLQENLRLSKH